MTGYTLTTGNDTGSYSDRKKIWTLEARASSSDEWTTIDSRGVTISSDKHDYDTAEENVETDARVRFIGTYASQTFSATDKSILFMGAENKLYYPLSGAIINAQRAYFKIGDDGAQAPASIMAFNINFGDDEATGIVSISKDSRSQGAADGWYTLDGRKLQGKPTASGIYINNGVKVVIK